MSLLAENNPDPDSWWVWYASLPEKDSKISREFVENWLIQFTRMPEEPADVQQLQVGSMAAKYSGTRRWKAGRQNEGIGSCSLQTVKEHVGNPRPLVELLLPASRQKSRAGLAGYELASLVYESVLTTRPWQTKTHLFFSSQETPGQLG